MAYKKINLRPVQYNIQFTGKELGTDNAMVKRGENNRSRKCCNLQQKEQFYIAHWPALQNTGPGALRV